MAVAESTALATAQCEAKSATKDSSSSEHTLTVNSMIDAGIDNTQRDENVQSLAYQLTAQSVQSHLQFPFTTLEQSSLDVKSPNFNAKDWARAFYNVRYSEDGTPPREAGVAFQNLSVGGTGSPTDFQSTVGNSILKLPAVLGRGKQEIKILRNLDGVVNPGEMLCVLGPPGSGCSTLLKTIAGNTHGLQVSPKSVVNYHGITPKRMHTVFKGEAIYTAEVDDHFPMFTVGDTLYFAAQARAPRHIPGGLSREDYARYLRDVVMAMFGISHTINTWVGDDFIRGVSGGERKRVTIAEASLSYAPLQCYDNSTRGLDSANAVEFCRTLRTQSDVFGSTSLVAIYQSPQAAYDLFDKVIVLYEGRQIYFGPTNQAKAYFEVMGFECPTSQTTPDFLTSMTSPIERVIRSGFENTVPRTSDDFAQRWRDNPERAALVGEIDAYLETHQFEGADAQRFTHSRKIEKSPKQRERSPYTLSYWDQIKLCMWREIQRIKTSPGVQIFVLLFYFFQALIVASIFYNQRMTSASFYSRGGIMYMMVLLNGLSAMMDIFMVHQKRKIVEKHNRYALYHPSADSIASIITDIPFKILNSLFVNMTMYFMSNLRREPGAFFFFLLVSFIMTMAMSMFFRVFSAVTKTPEQAMAPSSVILLALVLYTGFVIPIKNMRGWISWFRWLNPIGYGFESVMVNEFHGRQYACSYFVPSGPGYEDIAPNERACAVEGSVRGETFVDGATYIQVAYGYFNSHRWRNVGILVVFTVVLFVCQLWLSEVVASERSTGEVLVFRRRRMHQAKAKAAQIDEENGSSPIEVREKHNSCKEPDTGLQKQSSVFHWEDVCYDIKIKKETRVILDHVDGWIKPGTLTALMGVSGAGKTTLLDVLADRTSIGVISGSMLVDGRQRDESFQRKTGYVQQQDLHLETSTVREALEFSALLRQPLEYTREEKLRYVDHVIKLLDMEAYADAIVGVPGIGLNVEQRKRLTIGIELASRPKLLLFLDEPTSGLDSQTSWSIVNLMEKLTKDGQTILCTIHQPSAMLFQRFDRLLLLAHGGRTVYFGEIGKNSTILLDYFLHNGGAPCPEGTNPAEHMLKVIGAAPGAHTDIDWPVVWRESKEYREVRVELANLRKLADQPLDSDASSNSAFAAPFMTQLQEVVKRVFQQYWRMPSYIYSKALLCVVNSLFIGFSFFNLKNTMQGLQNQMFGVFIFLFIVVQLISQVIPAFGTQRSLYEARERQSRTYCWQVFVLSNIVVELAWNSLMAVLSFFAWYYPIGVYRNAEYTDSVHSRGILAFLLIWTIFLFASTFAHMCVAGVGSEQMAALIANILTVLMYVFSGVLAGPKELPRFWIFLYRVNPFTYFTSSVLSTTLGEAPVHCAESEYQQFAAPVNQTCGMYLQGYLDFAGGYVSNPQASSPELCQFCQLNSTEQFLTNVNVNSSQKWRDYGILWAYIVFNIAAAMFLYWLARVPKGKKSAKTD